MKRRGDPLSATFVRNVKTGGRYGDGRRGLGLYLRVYETANGRTGKSWAQRIRVDDRMTNLGLGSYPLVSLAEAREKALENRRATAQGRDPRRERAAVTFEALAEKVIRLHGKSWKEGSALPKAWRSTFERYAGAINDKAVSDVTRADVLGILTPIWHDRPAAARAVLQRVGTVLRFAVAKGLAEFNAADPGAIRAALPKANGGRGHHRALPHGQVAAALAKVRASGSQPPVRLALEFLALTAARVSEVLEAEWSEINLQGRVWTVPATWMKAKREHRIPLCGRALEILAEARQLAGGSSVLVFPSSLTGRALARGLPGAVFKKCGVGGTPHGLRSSFRDWCGESGVDRAAAEACLAHIVGGVEGSYFRTDLLEQRRPIMEAWGQYIA